MSGNFSRKKSKPGLNSNTSGQNNAGQRDQFATINISSGINQSQAKKGL